MVEFDQDGAWVAYMDPKERGLVRVPLHVYQELARSFRNREMLEDALWRWQAANQRRARAANG